MGRARKPLEMQKGNITSFEAAKKQQEEATIKTGAEQLKRPPAWLPDGVAKKEWRRLVKELNKIDIIGNLDKNNLAFYCYYYAKWVEVTDLIESGDLTVEVEYKNRIEHRKNPLIDVQKSYADDLRKFASLCGLTIDARLKAAVSKITKKEEEIKTSFGQI